MLTGDDIPTIKFALDRRLDKEPGVKVLDIRCRVHDDYIHVYVELFVGNSLEVNSEFQLPVPFEHSHLLNECNEIAEQCKAARMEFWVGGRRMIGRRKLAGTGLRGRWAQYG